MAADIAETGQTVYIRLMAEMNGHWNAYSAYNADGSARRGGHSAHWFKLAWRRFTLIIRGGSRDKINRKLVHMGLPRILHATSADDPVYAGGPGGIPLPIPEQMPQPRVAMMWVPQSFGSPNISGNQPGDYWPGGRYVDWVGTDFYSRFPNFDKLERFYDSFRGKPFVFGEWALWGRDDPAFVRRLFRWITTHPRVRMQLYNQGKLTDGPFRLNRYPRSRAALQRALAHPRNLTLP
jgi:hypothetical protein